MKNRAICAVNIVIVDMMAVLLLLLLLAGCETATHSRFSGNLNKELALKKYTDLGLVYLHKGDTAAAMPPLRRALEIDPKSADVFAAFAMLFQLENDRVLAQEYFNRALSYSSGVNKTRIRNNYASFLFKSERVIDACEQLDLASRDAFYERRATVYENLGICYQRLGKRSDALVAYERAIDIDGMRARALLEASLLQFEYNNIDKSGHYYRLYQRMVRYKMVSDSPQGLWLGMVLARYSGHYDVAASYALKLGELFPESTEHKRLRMAE